PARTLPRNTQYDHAEYATMIGSRNTVPIIMNAWDLGLDADCQRSSAYGTTIGKMLIARPRYAIRKMPSAARNGTASRSFASERQTSRTSPNVTRGTGERATMLGQENQRSRTCGSWSGVQTLTI